MQISTKEIAKKTANFENKNLKPNFFFQQMLKVVIKLVNFLKNSNFRQNAKKLQILHDHGSLQISSNDWESFKISSNDREKMQISLNNRDKTIKFWQNIANFMKRLL